MDKAGRLSIVRFPARAYQLKQIRSIVHSAMKQLGCAQLDSDKIVLAINEACMNVIQHAYAEDQGGEIILEIFDEHSVEKGSVLFRLTDFAAPVDECRICSRDLDDVRPGGLGVHIIQEVMDSVEFKHPADGKGNILEMRKRLDCREEPHES
jgi:sigma-B regulation protein RsbU (phosphoserine phosphatase)